jgi:hypothetical protein
MLILFGTSGPQMAIHAYILRALHELVTVPVGSFRMWGSYTAASL